MSKEYLEAFEVITGDNYHCDEETFYHNRAIVEQALHRLESIDNSEPSEALECVEDLIFNFSVDEYVYRYDNNLQVIKNALLKAQEQKQYLKWEDLEFKEEEQSIQVLLNGKKYTMFYYDDDVSFDTVVIGGVFIDYCDKQFFNDLHLERVEE